ncbi:hypothetical protein NEFER03_2236 [Nematocida sp. LUAm3]|nr:hypothetical protein NEFER03_2236 [Nematocida sp. LUAm3]KAI5176461.1 hypothetical protein NEFER02_2213 [Nematocida sp. LUAm2]KAI5179336.1 hypothetical protein NEFER01_2179 [Nematocida sp. LUAm1]
MVSSKNSLSLRRRYAIEHTWRMFVVFMVLLNMFIRTEISTENNMKVCAKDAIYTSRNSLLKNSKKLRKYSMKDALERNTQVSASEKTKGKKKKMEIAKALLNSFYISQDSHYPSKNRLSIEDLCVKTRYYEGKYYIDLKGCLIGEDTYNTDISNYMNLEKALEEIGGIGCTGLKLDTHGRISFDLAKMLFEKTIVEERLCMHSIPLKSTYSPNDTAMASTQKLPLELGWKRYSPIALSIRNCPEIVTETILKWGSSYKIKELVVQKSDVKKLDLSETMLTQECSIALENLPNLKRIMLSGGENTESPRVKSKLPIRLAKKVLNFLRDIFSSATIVHTLSLDRNTFKSLAISYKACPDASLKDSLKVKNLHLDYAPYTFQKIAGFSPPWIQTQKVFFHVECRDGWGIRREEVMSEKYSLKTLKSLGISCSELPFYESISSRHLYSKYTASDKFIKSIANTKDQNTPLFFLCLKKSSYCSIRSPFRIDLENSKKIQEAIKTFQSKYDVIYIREHYRKLDIFGSITQTDDPKLLEKIFKCMGQRIEVDTLSFHNMEGSVGKNPREQESLHIEVSISRFILKKLKFHNSQEDFIRSMLTAYSYSPGAKIYIDCKSLKEEDLWSLCQEAVEHSFSEIILENAPNPIQDIYKLSNPSWHSMNNQIHIYINDQKWLVKHLLFSRHLFLKRCILSHAYFYGLTTEKEHQDVFRKKSKKNIRHSLTCSSIEEASVVLKKVLRPVCFVTHLNIFMRYSRTSPPTTIAELAAFICKLRAVFIETETLCIFNLKIREEKKEGLSSLREVLCTGVDFGLNRVFLRDYTPFNEKGEAMFNPHDYCIIPIRSPICVLRSNLKKRNILTDFSTLWRVLACVPFYSLKSWERNLIIYEGCPVCLEPPSHIVDLYIIHQCMHAICYACIENCYNAGMDMCPSCRGPAHFNESFYSLRLKGAEKRTPVKQNLIKTAPLSPAQLIKLHQKIEYKIEHRIEHRIERDLESEQEHGTESLKIHNIAQVNQVHNASALHSKEFC